MKGTRFAKFVLTGKRTVHYCSILEAGKVISHYESYAFGLRIDFRFPLVNQIVLFS